VVDRRGVLGKPVSLINEGVYLLSFGVLLRNLRRSWSTARLGKK